ncbi:unnamed protein product [Peniophora sp. CBMAI 1063]|nr:unnamed protein product [Peniophora sp. CBMAI 1063]
MPSNTSPWLIVVALTMIAVYQAIDLLYKTHVARQLDPIFLPSTVKYNYSGHDFPNRVPLRLREAALTTEWAPTGVYGLYADDDWRSLWPPGDRILVHLGPHHERFAIAMYQQLHTLDVMRIAYTAARAEALGHPGNATAYDDLVDHCLRYLQKVVLCNADPTLLPAIPIADTGGYAAESDGVTHRCHDWTQLRDWVKDNMQANAAAAEAETGR